jgi:hypothetical protein
MGADSVSLPPFRKVSHMHLHVRTNFNLHRGHLARPGEVPVHLEPHMALPTSVLVPNRKTPLALMAPHEIEAQRENFPRNPIQCRAMKISHHELEVPLREDPAVYKLASSRCLQVSEPLMKFEGGDEGDEKSKDIEAIASNPVAFIDWLFTYSLRRLADRGSHQSKQEVLRWVFAPDIDGMALLCRPGEAPRWVPIIQSRCPFSFQWMCLVLGLNHAEIQHQLAVSERTRTREGAEKRDSSVLSKSTKATTSEPLRQHVDASL